MRSDLRDYKIREKFRNPSGWFQGVIRDVTELIDRRRAIVCTDVTLKISEARAAIMVADLYRK